MKHDIFFKKQLIEVFRNSQQVEYENVIKKMERRRNVSTKEFEKKNNTFKKREFYRIQIDFFNKDINDFLNENKRADFLNNALKFYKNFLNKSSIDEFKKHHKEYKKLLLNDPKRAVDFKEYNAKKKIDEEKKQRFLKENNTVLLSEFKSSRLMNTNKIMLNYHLDLERYQLIMENAIMNSEFEKAEYYRKTYQEIHEKFIEYQKMKSAFDIQADKNYKFYLENVSLEEKYLYGDDYFNVLVNTIEGNLIFQHYKTDNEFSMKVAEIHKLKRIDDELETLRNMSLLKRKMETSKRLARILNGDMTV